MTATPQWASVPPDSDSMDAVVASLRANGWLVRLVRGERMKSTQEALLEFAAAFQFPAYFHANWHSFDECMADLSWLSVDKGVAVVVTQAELVLQEADSALADLVTSLGYAAREWRQTSELGQGADRGSKEFTVVLERPDSETRWAEAGAQQLTTYAKRP